MKSGCVSDSTRAAGAAKWFLDPFLPSGTVSPLEPFLPGTVSPPSWIFCDDLASVRKSQLTDFVGTLSSTKLSALSQALRIALDIP